MFSRGLDSLLSRQVCPDVPPDKTHKRNTTNRETLILDPKGEPIPKKFREDVEKLQAHFADKFVTGLSVHWSLHQALEILPKERKRVDAFDSLSKYLSESWGIEMKVTSPKLSKNEE